MAGVAGLEPTLTVLETAVLPLNYTPIAMLYNYTKFLPYLQVKSTKTKRLHFENLSVIIRL